MVLFFFIFSENNVYFEIVIWSKPKPFLYLTLSNRCNVSACQKQSKNKIGIENSQNHIFPHKWYGFWQTDIFWGKKVSWKLPDLFQSPLLHFLVCAVWLYVYSEEYYFLAHADTLTLNWWAAKSSDCLSSPWISTYRTQSTFMSGFQDYIFGPIKFIRFLTILRLFSSSF